MASTMTVQEQMQMAAEIVREPREDIAEALKVAVRQWQAACTAAEMQRWNTTVKLYQHALSLRDAIAEMK